MIKPEEVHVLVESIKQHSGTPPDSALAALYELEHCRYGTVGSRPQETEIRAYAPHYKRIDVAMCRRCNGPMRIIQIEPVGPFELRSLECLNCKRQRSLVVKSA